jgi:AraC-like DNA-binding protein
MIPTKIEAVLRQQLLELLEREDTIEDAVYTAIASNEYVGWLEFLQKSVSLTGDTSLALRFGQQLGLGSFGTIGFALQSCPDVRQAIKLLVRYNSLFKRGSLWKTFQDSNNITLRFSMKLGSLDQQRLMTEMAFSQLFSIMKFLTGENLVASEVHLNYAKPKHYLKYKKSIPAPLIFNQEYSQIMLTEHALDMPISSANPAGNIIFQQQCEEMLRSLKHAENTTAAVRRILINEIGNLPNLDQVGEKLHMSKSTLKRRLESESTNFRIVCDEVRNLLAKKYLSDTKLSVEDIAHLLGYTAMTNFRRAFIRWNKIAPSKFRETS